MRRRRGCRQFRSHAPCRHVCFRCLSGWNGAPECPGSCCNGSFSSFPSSCPFFLHSFFSPLPAASPLVLSVSSSFSPRPLSPLLLLLSSSVCTQFSSLPCGGSGSRYALLDKTRTFKKRFNEWWEWTTRCTAATEAVGTTFPALLQGRRLKGLINFGGSIWFAMERVVAVQRRAGHTASVRHSESLADRSTFSQDW